MSLLFSRDTRVFLVKDATTWEIPVLDGFSFSQATNASEITLNEMESTAGESRRARQMFNDSYAPAEWSFQSYARPNSSQPVEDALWASFFYKDAYTGTTAGPITVAASSWVVTSTASNKSNLGTFDLYFVMGASTDADENYADSATVKIYKIETCVVNEASIDFEVDGIATISWSGFGKIISEAASFDGSVAVARDVDGNNNYIRNRLTTLSLSSSEVGDLAASAYQVTLTGGNITFSNNITYLTPETLGEINQPLEHVTGTRSIGGNFTCYIGTGVGESAELFENLIEATNTITNDFETVFTIGGATGPRITVSLPKCHLEIPTHSIEDVISLDTAFHALPSDIDSADEVTITYRND